MGGHQYMCTQRQLVTFWWTFLLRSRWTKIKSLYIIARYAPFFLITVYLWLSLAQDENSSECQTLNKSFLITYALWNNNRIVLVAMMLFLLALIVASVSISMTTNTSSDVTTSAIPGIPGCSLNLQGVQFFLPFIMLFVFQLGLVSLTLVRVIQSWRLAKGHLYAVVVKHNIYYYACALLLSAVNVLLPILISDSIYDTLLEHLEIFILAILATRMHLHLWRIDRLVLYSVTSYRVGYSASFVEWTTGSLVEFGVCDACEIEGIRGGPP
ncbi:hypothetical protein EDB19DRAFT_1832778 [Suillus lakei]|nr:hypothetical protein EDB19DRAFT_1832778 [Suillus lakei]